MDMETLDLSKLFTSLSPQQFQRRFHNKQQWKFIGRGSGANVYQVKDYNNGGAPRALKIYNQIQLSDGNIGDLKRQVCNLQRMKQQSQYFVTLYEAVRWRKGKLQQKYAILLDLCYCSLKTVLSREKNLDKKDKYEYCLRIATAVKKMHKNQMMHRDLKPENILMKIIKGKQQPVITDFGHSKQITNDPEMTSIRGTPKYINPNFASNASYGYASYGYEWDIYSLGLIFYQIFSDGYFLFEVRNSIMATDFQKLLTEKLKKIDELLSQKQFLSPQMKQLISFCLKANYSQNTVAQKIVSQLQQQIKKQDPNNISPKKQNSSLSDTKDQTIQQKQQQNIIQTSPHTDYKIKQNYQISKSLNKTSEKIQSIGLYSSHKQNQLKNQFDIIQITNSQLNNYQSTVSKLIHIADVTKEQIQLCEQSVIYLNKLKSIQQKLNTFRIIQKLKFQKQIKMILLILCLKYQLIQIKIIKQEKSNKYVEQPYNNLKQRIQNEYDRLLKQYKENKYSYNEETKKALEVNNIETKIVVKVFSNYIKNNDTIFGEEGDKLLLLLD